MALRRLQKRIFVLGLLACCLGLFAWSRFVKSERDVPMMVLSTSYATNSAGGVGLAVVVSNMMSDECFGSLVWIKHQKAGDLVFSVIVTSEDGVGNFKIPGLGTEEVFMPPPSKNGPLRVRVVYFSTRWQNSLYDKLWDFCFKHDRLRSLAPFFERKCMEGEISDLEVEFPPVLNTER